MDRGTAVRGRKDLLALEIIYKVTVPLVLVMDVYKALEQPLSSTTFIHSNLYRHLKVAGSLNCLK